jgi:hypothetical protein
VALLAGLGYAVHSALTTTGATRPASTKPAAPAAGQAAARLPAGPARRDAIAAAPMLTVPPAAARSGTPAARPGPSMLVPPAGTVGPAEVATGFPRTSAGAVGQLAAITTTVLQGMSIERAHAVHEEWAAPGAVPAQDWDLVANIQAFLAAADGVQPGVDPGVTVAAVPVAGQVKGVDGPGWVLACVLLDVRARAATTARIAYGHCERMQWDPTPLTGDSSTGGRWVIGPGKPPAPAPSTWPGTDLALEAGWRTWATGPDQ